MDGDPASARAKAPVASTANTVRAVESMRSMRLKEQGPCLGNQAIYASMSSKIFTFGRAARMSAATQPPVLSRARLEGSDPIEIKAESPPLTLTSFYTYMT